MHVGIVKSTTVRLLTALLRIGATEDAKLQRSTQTYVVKLVISAKRIRIQTSTASCRLLCCCLSTYCLRLNIVTFIILRHIAKLYFVLSYTLT